MGGHRAHEQVRQIKQAREEHDEGTGNDKVADGRANVEPAALVADEEEKVERHDVGRREHEHKQRRGGQADRSRQDAKDGCS